MTTIKTQFSVDDIVFHAIAIQGRKKRTCPDCLGTMRWECHLPSGEVMQCECATCYYGYGSSGTIEEYDYWGEIEELTIGSVRYEDGKESYMCKETGVGSGRVYEGVDLHTSRDAANSALPHLIAAKKKDHEEWSYNQWKQRRKRGPKAGLVAFYRKEVQEANKKLKFAKKRLAEINGGE
jgi:hypothetical protein